MQRLTGRWRVPGLLSLVLAAALGATASTAHADLTAGAPTNIPTGFFDDHSISGDNHAGWGPTEEPLAVRFNAAVANDATRVVGVANPAFTTTISGFVNGDTVATATTGSASFTTTC